MLPMFTPVCMWPMAVAQHTRIELGRSPRIGADVVSNANAPQLVRHIKYTGGIAVAAEVATITYGTA